MTPTSPAPVRARTLFSRALRLRCPVCGGHPILLSWFTLASSCPGCGFHLDRDEPGYWLGSYTVNLFLAEGVWLAFFAGGILASWPDVPWTVLLYGGLAVAVASPIALFPFTRMIYLAIDLAARPPEPQDLVTPAERRFPRPRVPSPSHRAPG